MTKAAWGIVYVATGEGYVREARESVASLKAAMPGVPVCLITDQQLGDPSPFDSVVLRSDAERSPADKMLAVHCPFERAVFLDTDTFVAGDLSDIFEVLERFELALLPDTKRGWDYKLPDVTHAFGEFNTGVIGFRNSPEVRAFFEDWRERYVRLRKAPGFVNDQPAFREAVWFSPLRVAPLPSEYHFLGNVPNYIMWEARLIHARGDRPAIARLVNRILGARVFIPDVGVVPAFHGKKGWLSELLRVARGMGRLLFQRPTAAAEMNPTQWSNAEKRG